MIVQQALGFVDVPRGFDSRRLHHYFAVIPLTKGSL
jgi:hypothetical protein